MTFNNFNLKNHFNSITSNINSTLNINLSNSLSIFILNNNDSYSIFITKYIFTNYVNNNPYHLFSSSYQKSYDNLNTSGLLNKLSELQLKYSNFEYKINNFYEK